MLLLISVLTWWCSGGNEACYSENRDVLKRENEDRSDKTERMQMSVRGALLQRLCGHSSHRMRESHVRALNISSDPPRHCRYLTLVVDVANAFSPMLRYAQELSWRVVSHGCSFGSDCCNQAGEKLLAE